MRRAVYRRTTTGMSLFPFLAVLICTMGALIVLLVMVLQQARVQASSTPAPPSAQSAGESDEARKLRESKEDLDWKRDILHKQREDHTAELSKSRMELSHLEDHIRRLQDQWKQIEAQVNELQKLGESRSQDQAGLKAELDKIQAQIDVAKRQLEEAKRKVDSKPRSFAIIPYQGPNGTKRRPIYIECAEEGIIIHPENIIFQAPDFQGPLGPGNPLDAALRTIREYMVRTGDSKRDGEPYPLLVVRPNGSIAYSLARSAMRSWDDEFGYELIDEKMQLKFPPADPALEELLLQTIKDARTRQAALAAAMPTRYRSDEGLGFVASPNGGFAPTRSDDDSSTSMGSRSGGGGGRGIGSGRGNGGDGVGSGGFGTTSSSGAGSGFGRGGTGGQFAGGPGANGQGFGGQGMGGNGFTGQGSGGSAPGSGGSGSFGSGGTGSGSFGSGGTGSGGSGSSGQGSAGSGPGGQAAGGAGQGGQGSGGSSSGAGGQGSQGIGQSGTGASLGQGGGSPGVDAMGGQSAQNAMPSASFGTYAPKSGGNSSNGSTSGANGNSGSSSGSPDSSSSSSSADNSSSATSSSNQVPMESLAKRKGRDWALKNKVDHATGITRPIRVQCFADRLVIQSEKGEAQRPKVIMLQKGRVRGSAEEFVAGIWKHMETWGLAVRGGYWKPLLRVEVAPGAEQQYAELEAVLRDSGLDVQRK